MTAKQKIDPRVLDEAVAWQSCLLSGEATEAEQASCAAWRSANPAHEIIWQRLQALDEQFLGQPSNAHHIIHSARGHSRRAVLKSLLLGGLSVPLLYTGYDWSGSKRLFADISTRLGEYRSLILPDGSRLHVNTATSLDIAYTDKERRLVLHTGEILIDSVPDVYVPKRELIVESPLAEIKALGTRFMVKQTDDAKVSVFSGATQVTHKHTAEKRILESGFAFGIDSSGFLAVQVADQNQQSWIKRRLVFDGVPLSHVIDELNRYYPGFIFCADEVAAVQVSGVYPLADKQAILTAMQQSLPIRVQQRSRFWTLINAA